MWDKGLHSDQSKNDQISCHRNHLRLTPNFYIPLFKVFVPLLVLEIGHYSLNTSFDLKFLSNRMSQFFQGILKTFLPVMHIFTRIDNL